MEGFNATGYKSSIPRFQQTNITAIQQNKPVNHSAQNQSDSYQNSTKNKKKRLSNKQIGALAAIGTAVIAYGIFHKKINSKISTLFNTNDLKFLPWKKEGFKTPQGIEINNIPTYSQDAQKLTENYNQSHRIDFCEKIVDGYRDGGRHLAFNTKGAPTSSPYREIIVIDRKNDPVLQKTIDVLKHRISKKPNINEKEKTNEMLKYVDEIFSGGKDDNDLINMTETFPKKEVRLGEIINSGAGVCRHRSLLAKVLADETGIDMAIVRGNVGKNNGAHIWNEVQLKNGEKYIFDGMHRKMTNISDLNIKVDHYALNYKDVKGNLIYLEHGSPIHTIYYALENIKPGTSTNLGFAEFSKTAEGKILIKGLSKKKILINGNELKNQIELKADDRIKTNISSGELEFNIPKSIFS